MRQPAPLMVAVLLLCSTMLLGCGGSGPDGPVIRPPEAVRWGMLVVPAELEADVQYWTDLNWRAGFIPVNVAGESLSRRRALMYYSLLNGKFTRSSTLVIQTVRCQPGEKLKAMQALCRSIGFDIADSKYSPHREAETYYIWITDFYGESALGWLSDHILSTYPDDFLCVQPMVSDKPFPGTGPHSEGAGASF